MDCLILFALVAGTLIVFGRLRGADFFNYDDPTYVSANPNVRSGLSGRGTAWAFTTFHAGMWIPLTWLSLQADAQLFGPGPAGFHQTNVVLHAVNAALVYLLLRRLTQARWRSACVAALFAFHPLHVESVAWVCERKDVLSTLFGLLALLAYAWYAEQPGAGRYAATLLAFTLSLLAKPMLVTLPGILLLLDYWPLARWPGQSAAVPLRRLLLEKVPLVVLASLSVVVTVAAQHRGGAVQSLARVGLTGRVANALLAYGAYLRQMLWPVDLAPFYPHGRAGLLDPAVLRAGLVLAGLSAGVVICGRARPYLRVGWLWYLGALVPVIGIVQVGLQARADRFTYVPLLGIFLALVWGAAELARRARLPAAVPPAAAAVILLACAVLSWVQAGRWHDSETLWRHTLRVAPDGGIAWLNLGTTLSDAGRWEAALACFEKAVTLDDRDAGALCNRGTTLFHLGRTAAAEKDLRDALRLDPKHSLAHTNLGILLAGRAAGEEAKEHYAAALRTDPDLFAARICLGMQLFEEGELDAAAGQFAEAVRRHPEQAAAHGWLGRVETALGRLPEAVASLRESARLDPQQALTWHDLAQALGLQGRWDEAARASRTAAALAPASGEARGHLAFCLLQLGDANAARHEWDLAARAQPDWPRDLAGETWKSVRRVRDRKDGGARAVYLARVCCAATGDRDAEMLDLLAAAYARAGQFDQAVDTARRAVGRAGDKTDLIKSIRTRLKFYEKRRPDPAPGS